LFLTAHFFKAYGIIAIFNPNVKNSKVAKFGQFAQKKLQNKRLQTCNYLKNTFN